MASPNMTKGDVCKLLGRVAFGATAADIDTWTGKPYADLVDRLLLVETAPVHQDESGAVHTVNPFNFYGNEPGEDAALAWMQRMRTTQFPLVERMTLFWHGHFATAIRPARPTKLQVVNQVQTLRTHALGNFRTIVELMTIDPAMLYWLNGNENRIPQPNENYARELFELFTLGKRPQVYTERDIREAARALTGWYVPNTELVPAFDPTRHDKGTKKILGKTVTDSGADEYKKVIDIALGHPAAARFLAFKMVQEFAYTPTSRNLLRSPGSLVAKVATTLTNSNWDVAAAMRTLMLADEFRFSSPVKGQQRVRQPVELAVAACKALGVPADNTAFLEPLERMGQKLYSPPNVGGWPVGSGWLSPVTTLGRYDLALQMRSSINIFNPTSAVSGIAVNRMLPKPEDVEGWAKVFGIPSLSPVTVDAIESYLRKRKGDPEANRRDGVVVLILSSPEWVVM